MKHLTWLLCLLILMTSCKKDVRSATPEEIIVSVAQLDDKNVTDSIKMLADTTVVSIRKSRGNIIAIAYYNTTVCGKYTAKAVKKGNAILLVLNDEANPCTSNKIGYYKVEAVIDNPAQDYKITKDYFITNLKPGEQMEHNEDKYPVGDINNDKIPDTATVIYDVVYDAKNNSYIEDCGRRVCIIKADFGDKIASIEADTYGMEVQPVMDVNGDGANEIVLSTHWYSSGHLNIDLYTYKGNKWKILASTEDHFMTEEIDLKRKVIKENGKYYLIGEKWAEDGSGIIMERILIE